MPYHWHTDTGEAPAIAGASFHDRGDPPLAVLDLSAHNSLTPRGFVVFIGATLALIFLPLIAVVGSPVLWGLLPFMMAALGGIWWALKQSWAERDIRETVMIWSDRTEIRHTTRRGVVKEWAANTYWITVHMHARRGVHRQYITLTGSQDNREVELGAFLTEDERRALFPVVRDMIGSAAEAPPRL